jgi:hypothetical protein
LSWAGQPIATPAVHTPVLHAEVPEHLLSFPHDVPSGASGFEQAPDAGSQVPTLWHPSLAVQATAVPGLQTPPRQVSRPLHLLPSSQSTPSARVGFEQVPVAGAQVPTPWQRSRTVQATAVPALHEPPWQVSRPLHLLPSSQLVPFGWAGFEQLPLFGSQVPTVWQRSSAVHVTAVPAAHEPLWQVSRPLHLFPSSQLVPSVCGGLVQTPVAGVHVPTVWQRSIAAQTTAVPWLLQVPLLQLSAPLHLLPSSQLVPSILTVVEQVPSQLQTRVAHESLLQPRQGVQVSMVWSMSGLMQVGLLIGQAACWIWPN